MSTLTEEQRRILERADKFGTIEVGDDEICPGIHFCFDWDQLPVCRDSPEAECCGCGRLSEGRSKAAEGGDDGEGK